MGWVVCGRLKAASRHNQIAASSIPQASGPGPHAPKASHSRQVLAAAGCWLQAYDPQLGKVFSGTVASVVPMCLGIEHLAYPSNSGPPDLQGRPASSQDKRPQTFYPAVKVCLSKSSTAARHSVTSRSGLTQVTCCCTLAIPV